MLDPGSVKATVNASGTVTERNDYHPYGARDSYSSLTKTSGNRWRFSGKEESLTQPGRGAFSLILCDEPGCGRRIIPGELGAG